jgi:hypothetical protein
VNCLLDDLRIASSSFSLLIEVPAFSIDLAIESLIFKSLSFSYFYSQNISALTRLKLSGLLKCSV